MDLSLSKFQEIVKDRVHHSPWGRRVRHDVAAKQTEKEIISSILDFIYLI